MLKVSFEVMAMMDSFIPSFTGHIIQGFFSRMLEQIDPSLCKRLHAKQKVKPYAIFPLKPSGFKMATRSGMWHIAKGRKYLFGFSIIDDSFEKLIIEEFVTKPIPKVTLANVSFAVMKINFKKTSYDKLLKKEANSESSLNKLDFLFQTPVYFKEKSKGCPVILPVPELLFSNLARIWNTYSPVKVDVNKLRGWVSKNVFIRKMKIFTREVYVGNSEKIVGFKGHVSFTVKSNTMKKWLVVLSCFSEYSNVGNKRTKGLGVTSFRYNEQNQSKV